jgi:predicted negative regulator of RcsB-dependent stress response
MPRRRRPPRRRSHWARAVAAIKRNPVKSATAVLVLLGALVPAWKGIEWLDTETDPWQPARHVFVYEQVGAVSKKAAVLGEQNQNILRDLQVDTANGKLDATTNELKRWQVELAKPGNDQRTVDLITQRISALQATKDKLDAQLKTLTAIKGP